MGTEGGGNGGFTHLTTVRIPTLPPGAKFVALPLGYIQAYPPPEAYFLDFTPPAGQLKIFFFKLASAIGYANFVKY